MLDLFATLTVVFVSWICFSIISRFAHFLEWERRWVDFGFGFHVVLTWVQYYLVIVSYGGGDMRYYYRSGAVLRDWAINEKGGLLDVIQIAAGIDVWLPFYIFGIGHSTGAMAGVGGLLLLLTQGSWVAANTLIGIIAYGGLVSLYIGFRQFIGPNRLAIWAGLFVPSVGFWSGGLQKEALAVLGLGVTVGGIAYLLRGVGPWRLVGLFAGGVGSGVLMVFKPYILVALLTSSAALLIKGRKGGFLVRLVMGVVVGGVAFYLITKLLPQYQLSEVVEQTALLQTTHGRIHGGSNVTYAAAGDATVAGQLRNVPQAALSAFFRPIVFEAHNLTSLLGAVEMGLLTLFVIGAVVKNSISRLWANLISNPVLLFCLVFVAVFGVAVGLAAPNLGTLSRYRSPMMPLYTFLVFALYFGKQGKQLKQGKQGKWQTR